jgi:menaquinone-dependent protoporphyrinogen oxidase
MNPRVLIAYATRCGSTLEVAQAVAQNLEGRGYTAELRRAELKRLPTPFFTVHGQNLGANEASRKARLAYIDPVRAMVQPGAEAFFAGKLDSSRLSFGARMLCKLMKVSDRDLRDWGAIHAWAQGVFRSAVKS